MLATNFAKNAVLLFSFADDDTIKNVSGCHGGSVFPQCWGGLVIKITYSEFGGSDCYYDAACCPSASDCIVPADEERLEEIKAECQGRGSCSVVASRVGFPCSVWTQVTLKTSITPV